MNPSCLHGLHGELTIPGDKSISHRSIMLGSLAEGTTEIENFLNGADCLSTISCFRQMGISIEEKNRRIYVHGQGLHGLKASDSFLDCGNSGTTSRLLAGILAGQSFSSILTGDSSLCSRPMKRIMIPLREMGADIDSLVQADRLPLRLVGKPLAGVHYNSPIASAQVKSAILLAGLYADSPCSVTEPILSRDHTERMLASYGVNIQQEHTTCTVFPTTHLEAQKIQIPGDISSAAYFIAAALLVPHSEICINHVGINSTRKGILTVCQQMGADITLENIQTQGEPTADIIVRSSSLHGITIQGDIIPTLIDELPILAVLACFAQGTTIIRDAAELKTKESNRIRVMVENLSAMGADIKETEDGMIIHGGPSLHGATINTHKDHRIAMSFAIANLGCSGEVHLVDGDCVNISYPHFYSDLQRLMNHRA